MFVFEALLLTFMTTPMVNLIYPPSLRTYGLGGDASLTPSGGASEKEKYLDGDADDEEGWRYRFVVVLDEFKHMPGIMALTKLVMPPSEEAVPGVAAKKTHVNALRLIELSDRTSTIIKSAITERMISSDPLIGVFKMFGEQSDMPVSTSLAVVAQDEWSHAVATHAERHGSQLVLLPWIPPTSVLAGDHAEQTHRAKADTNPFDMFFGVSSKENATPALYSQFVRGVFRHCRTDVGLFVDLGDNAGTNGQQHILLPFFGGPDDRLALEFVVQLCMNPRITATVIRVRKHTSPGITKPELAIVDEKRELEPTGTSVTVVRVYLTLRDVR